MICAKIFGNKHTYIEHTSLIVLDIITCLPATEKERITNRIN